VKIPGEQPRKQRAQPPLDPADLGGDEQDDFELSLEDVDQNAPEPTPTSQGGGTADAAEGGRGGPKGEEAGVAPGEDSAAKKKQKMKKSREQLKAGLVACNAHATLLFQNIVLLYEADL